MGEKLDISGELPLKEAYNDLLHPAAQQLGTALGGIIKIALTPVSALIWGYDKIAAYLIPAIENILTQNKVPPEDVVPPDPAVFVPTVQALTYSADKKELRETYVKLLAASMTKNVKNYAYPAYAEIIKQLTPDEVKIISHLYLSKRQWPVVSLRQSSAKHIYYKEWYLNESKKRQEEIQDIYRKILSGECTVSFISGNKVVFVDDMFLDINHLIVENDSLVAVPIDGDKTADTYGRTFATHICMIGKYAHIEYLQNIQDYLDNLSRLKLINLQYSSQIADQTEYNAMLCNPEIKQSILAQHNRFLSENRYYNNQEYYIFKKGILDFSSFGRRFANLCISPTFFCPTDTEAQSDK